MRDKEDVEPMIHIPTSAFMNNFYHIKVVDNLLPMGVFVLERLIRGNEKGSSMKRKTIRVWW